MNQTSRTDETVSFYKKASRIAALVFGDKTKAYYKVSNYFFIVGMFSRSFRVGFREAIGFFHKRFFFAIKYALKELERLGVFYWFHKKFHWFDLGARYSKEYMDQFVNLSPSMQERCNPLLVRILTNIDFYNIRAAASNAVLSGKPLGTELLQTRASGGFSA